MIYFFFYFRLISYSTMFTSLKPNNYCFIDLMLLFKTFAIELYKFKNINKIRNGIRFEKYEMCFTTDVNLAFN